MKEFKDEKGQIISTVTELTPQLEVETVLHGKEKAEALNIFLDGDRTSPVPASDRTYMRIEFADDGKTVTKVVLNNDPKSALLLWHRW